MNNEFTRRCEIAIRDLNNFLENRKDDKTESIRLSGKIEGVKLVKDYAEQTFQEVVDFLVRLDEWLEENDSLASNSSAHVELDRILENLGEKKVQSPS